ncbi:MAG: hypothetical protein HQL99_15410 [Magnetococcales bacterium]|nr:hypothetical protein [Magnetococcales bacterium]
MNKIPEGPWSWYGNLKTNHIYLATERGGRTYVMDFARFGMRDAQPRFNTDKGMVKAQDLCRFEVGDPDVIGYQAAKEDDSVYRYDISEIDHPVARLIAAAPDLLAALLEAENGSPEMAERLRKAALEKVLGNDQR